GGARVLRDHGGVSAPRAARRNRPRAPLGRHQQRDGPVTGRRPAARCRRGPAGPAGARSADAEAADLDRARLAAPAERRKAADRPVAGVSAMRIADGLGRGAPAILLQELPDVLLIAGVEPTPRRRAFRASTFAWQGGRTTS